MKTCRKCGESKSLDNFSKHPSFKDGLNSRCKQCKAAQQREYYSENKGDILYKQRMSKDNRKAGLKKNFNMTVEEYERILLSQNGVCAICGEEDSRNLAVDHDHNCCPGRKTCGDCVRGLLCRRCNLSIGLFRDNIEVLRSAVKYMEVWPSQA